MKRKFTSNTENTALLHVYIFYTLAFIFSITFQEHLIGTSEFLMDCIPTLQAFKKEKNITQWFLVYIPLSYTLIPIASAYIFKNLNRGESKIFYEKMKSNELCLAALIIFIFLWGLLYALIFYNRYAGDDLTRVGMIFKLVSTSKIGIFLAGPPLMTAICTALAGGFYFFLCIVCILYERMNHE